MPNGDLRLMSLGRRSLVDHSHAPGSRDPPPLPCTAGAATCQAPSESPTHERDERHAACAPPLAQVGSGGRTDGGVLASEAVERVASDEDLASVESVPSIGGNGSDQKGEGTEDGGSRRPPGPGSKSRGAPPVGREGHDPVDERRGP